MKDRSRVRNCEFEVRLTEDECTYFRALSYKLGLSYSQLMRYCAMYCVKYIHEHGNLPEGFIY